MCERSRLSALLCDAASSLLSPPPPPPNCLAPVVDWLCVRDVDAAQQGGESTAALDALASVIRSETEAQCSVAVPGWELRYVLAVAVVHSTVLVSINAAPTPCLDVAAKLLESLLDEFADDGARCVSDAVFAQRHASNASSACMLQLHATARASLRRHRCALGRLLLGRRLVVWPVRPTLTPANPATVHAEMQIVDAIFFEQDVPRGSTVYIGASRRPCAMCLRAVQAANAARHRDLTFVMSRSSGLSFSGWAAPRLLGSPRARDAWLRRPAADACEEPQTDEWLLWHGTALSWMCPRRPNATFSCSAVCRSGCTVIRQRNCGDEFPTEHDGTLCLGSIVQALAVL